MLWIKIATAMAALVQRTASTTPNVPNHDDLNAVAVDLLLSNVPGQVHLGMYKQISEHLYIRELPWLDVYFTLKCLPPRDAAESVVKWQFRGYECSHDDGEGRVCSEFTTTKLESDGVPSDQTRVHVITRQGSLTDEERRLQFEMPVTVAPPTFTTQTAYYSYPNGSSSNSGTRDHDTCHLYTSYCLARDFSTGDFCTRDSVAYYFITRYLLACDFSASDPPAGDFLTCDFCTGDVLASDFCTSDFVANYSLAGDFSAGDFLTCDFCTGDVLASDFCTSDFVANYSLAGDFSTGDFLACDRRSIQYPDPRCHSNADNDAPDSNSITCYFLAGDFCAGVFFTSYFIPCNYAEFSKYPCLGNYDNVSSDWVSSDNHAAFDDPVSRNPDDISSDIHSACDDPVSSTPDDISSHTNPDDISSDIHSAFDDPVSSNPDDISSHRNPDDISSDIHAAFDDPVSRNPDDVSNHRNPDDIPSHSNTDDISSHRNPDDVYSHGVSSDNHAAFDDPVSRSSDRNTCSCRYSDYVASSYKLFNRNKRSISDHAALDDPVSRNFNAISSDWVHHSTFDDPISRNPDDINRAAFDDNVTGTNNDRVFC
ncbi:hypothetical protein PF002_g17845 [Phytophthora fragariae]|uniref:Uncharacterized protein n=1 Tax=Phytophthora fragariae TaxID=53985 RepID=A0A6A3Y881_9STRA|nr:hypothetical protein PF002_g17845 [Phytophthora fragariae]